MANPTPSKNPVWTANILGAVNKFGAPPNTSNRLPVAQANTILTQDYTGRLVGATAANPDAGAINDLTSPLTLTTNAVLINIPPNAASLRMMSTATFSFSEVGPAGSALTQYYSQPANTAITVETARISQLFITGTAPLLFYFQLI